MEAYPTPAPPPSPLPRPQPWGPHAKCLTNSKQEQRENVLKYINKPQCDEEIYP